MIPFLAILSFCLAYFLYQEEKSNNLWHDRYWRAQAEIDRLYAEKMNTKK